MDKKNVKLFILVSVEVVICITVIFIYAIYKDAVWALPALIIGIFAAIIIIAIPFANVIRFKWGAEKSLTITADNNPNNYFTSQELKSYNFSLTEGQIYEFIEKLFGANRYAYTFKISEIWVMDRATKFAIQIYRHAVKEEPQIITDEIFSLQCGDCLPIDGEQWQLTLDATENKTARFRANRL